MTTGTISYSASISGLILNDKIDLDGRHENIDRVEIKTESKTKIKTTFFLKNVYTDKEAISLTSNSVHLLFNRVAYKLNCQVGEPRCDGWSLPKKDKGRHAAAIIVLSSCIAASDRAETTYTPGEKSRNELKNFLDKPLSDLDRYLSYFRFSIGQQDSVSRFLFLYNILLMLNNDKQANVDETILEIDPSIAVSSHPRNKGKNETIYTKLRNEIDHVRENVDQAKTVAEVNNCLPGFQTIVKSALSNIL